MVPYEMEVNKKGYRKNIIQTAEIYSRINGPPPREVSATSGNILSKVRVPAGTVDMAGFLSRHLDDQEKKLIERLPFDEVIFTYLERDSIEYHQKDAFFGTEDKNVLAILVGTVAEDEQWKLVTAVLNVRRNAATSKPHKYFPKVIYLTSRMNMGRYEYINHDTVMKRATLRSEFEAFKKPSILSAIVRHQFFRHGTPISYDLTVLRSTYTSDLLEGAKLYAERTVNKSATVKQESNESHLPLDHRVPNSPELAQLPDSSPLGETEIHMRPSHQVEEQSTGTPREPNLRSSISAQAEIMSVEQLATLMEKSFSEIERSKAAKAALYTNLSKAQEHKQSLEKGMQKLKAEKRRMKILLEKVNRRLTILEEEDNHHTREIKNSEMQIQNALKGADPSVARIFKMGSHYRVESDGQDDCEPATLGSGTACE